MNNKNKTLLGILALVVLIGAAYLAYGSLSNRYSPNNRLELKPGDAQQSLANQAPALNSGLALSTATDQNEAVTQNNQPEQSESSGKTNAAPGEKTNLGGTAPTNPKTPAAKSTPESTTAANDTREKAADFTVQNSDGKSVKLSSLFGKPTVVNFWASWCGPCKSEMPHFDKAYSNYKGDVNFMMVDLVDGARETVKSGTNYVKNEGFSFPVYFDTQQEAAYTYKIQSIPTTLFIDSGGHIVQVVRGAMDESTLDNYIKSIK